MPTYRVTGEHIDTGEPVERTFTARDEADARGFLNRERIAVQLLENISTPATPSSTSTPLDQTILDELRALRQDIRTQTQLLDKTLNHRTSPFFKHVESRTRSAVGCGIIVGIALLIVVSLVLSVLIPVLGLIEIS